MTPLCLCKTFFCPSGSVSVVFVRYDSICDILKPSSDPGLTDYSRYAGTGEITVNSQVIAAAVKPADIYQLDHVTFTLRHNEVKTIQSADDRPSSLYCFRVSVFLCKTQSASEIFVGISWQSWLRYSCGIFVILPYSIPCDFIYF